MIQGESDVSGNVQSSRAQQNFGRLLDQALVEGVVVIERYGTPRAAIVEYGRYQRLLAAEAENLRRNLQEASRAVSARAAALTDAEVNALIEEARREAAQETGRHDPDRD
jgi:PHD/YefM family antitoxin component YafN of YafNO toxin-antitoxin module